MSRPDRLLNDRLNSRTLLYARTRYPHVASKKRGSALDGRTTRYAECAVSHRCRKLVDEHFGWMKAVGGLDKLRHRGQERGSAGVMVASRPSGY